MKIEDQLPPPDPEAASRGRLDRFRSEVISGGSVTERDVTPDGDGEPADRWVGIVSGLVILALTVWLAVTNVWMFLFALGIVVSVFLHEMGHFVTARLTGMKATQFFLGFGPRLWSFRRGETEYGVRALPFGAFVKIIGMTRFDEVPAADEGRTYRQQTYPRRMLVICAGSLMHMLIGIALLFTVFAVRGEFEQGVGAEAADIADGSPAALAGIAEDDVILSIGGVAIADAADLGPAVRSFEPADVVPIRIRRDDVEMTIEVGLGANTEEASPNFGAALLGVSPRDAGTWEPVSITTAATSSVTELFPIGWQSAQGIVKVLNPVNIFEHLSGRSEDLATRPTTVVGVTQVSGAVGESEGVIGLLYLLAALNVFVGVFNMFPLLPLDGGHAAIATYERIRERGSRRRYFADVEKLMPFAMGVITVLLLLFMAGLYLDIAKPLG